MPLYVALVPLGIDGTDTVVGLVEVVKKSSTCNVKEVGFAGKPPPGLALMVTV